MRKLCARLDNLWVTCQMQGWRNSVHTATQRLHSLCSRLARALNAIARQARFRVIPVPTAPLLLYY